MLRTLVSKEQAKAKMSGDLEGMGKSIVWHIPDIWEISMIHVSQEKLCPENISFG